MKDVILLESVRRRLVAFRSGRTVMLFFAVFASFFILGFFVNGILDTSSCFHFVNILFTFAWSFFVTALLLLLPRLIAIMAFVVVYFVFLIYGIAQHFYYMIFNKLFSFTVLSNADEGAGYAGIIFDYIDVFKVICFLLMCLVGVFVAIVVKKSDMPKLKFRLAVILIAVALFIASQFLFPPILGDKVESASWDSFNDPRYVYENYTDPHKCLGMVGYYQYLNRDFYNCFLKKYFVDYDDLLNQIDEFFKDYPSKRVDNEYTGIFKGKNVIIIMLESLDYPAISESNTPNVYKMMTEGINFTRYYSSIFGDGATFSNEFLLNTGICSPNNGVAAYSYIQNSFNESLPNLFKNEGYTANSFHKNFGWFYNRQLMHSSFGYESYNSYYQYSDSEFEVDIDTFLTDTPELMKKLFSEDDGDDSPFMSFVITYSAHLPYTYTDLLCEYAFGKYVPEGELLADREDLACYRAKARITDDMLGKLIEYADEDTVFVCVGDHFSYGLDEETLLSLKGEEWALRQNTPFFIYSKDPSAPRMTVDKLCSNADFLPTVANLFGLEVPDKLIGHDIFDESYDGYVIFSNYAWLTDELFWHDEVVEVYGEYTEEEVEYMTSYLYRRMKINEYILTVDYYKE